MRNYDYRVGRKGVWKGADLRRGDSIQEVLAWANGRRDRVLGLEAPTSGDVDGDLGKQTRKTKTGTNVIAVCTSGNTVPISRRSSRCMVRGEPNV